MKILVLVMGGGRGETLDYRGINRSQHYIDLLNIAQQTWDSINHPNVYSLYLINGFENKIENNIITVDCEDGYEMIHWKNKLAFDLIWELEWDYVFRVSASSYVNKKLLYEWAINKPKENCWCCIGGSGHSMLLSRDLIDILRKELTEEKNIVDDIAFSRVFEKHNIQLTPGAIWSQYDYEKNIFIPNYCIRLKNETNESQNRELEINAFKTVFNTI